MRNRKKTLPKTTPKYAILVDGETEIWYLQMLKKNEHINQITIDPLLPQKKKLKEQIEKVEKLLDDYDKVYWIVDLDTILTETQLAKKGKETSLDTLLNFKKKIEKSNNNIIIIINQPCLEFWFLIHFETVNKEFQHCTEARDLLKKHIRDYEKSEKFFVKSDNDIYKKLRENLGYAIEQSRKLPEFDPERPYKGCSKMYRLFDELGIIP